MGDELPTSNRIDRRSLLKQGLVLAGGAVVATRASAQDAPKTPAATPAAPRATANLHPPVVTVKGGKLRGFTDDGIPTFLAVPYAEAERFAMPKPVTAWVRSLLLPPPPG
jgi:hypothetical protein